MVEIQRACRDITQSSYPLKEIVRNLTVPHGWARLLSGNRMRLCNGDRTRLGSPAKARLRFRALSAIAACVIVLVLRFPFAVIDWVMSLQARWISTIYGLIFIAGEALSTFCFLRRD